jgi:hypothetical protein
MDVEELKTMKRRILGIFDVLIYLSFIWFGWQLHNLFP